jgi:hypothetical protein
MKNPVIQAIGLLLLGVGNLFVLSSMWVLGVTGTYLGTESSFKICYCSMLQSFETNWHV